MNTPSDDPLDYLVIGHIAHDRTPHGPVLGGTVSYAAIIAQAMSLRVGVLTSARPDDPVLAGLADIDYRLKPADSSTIFVNVYDELGNRTQVVEGQADVLHLADVPDAWRRAPIVHLGPLVHEIGETLTPQAFPQATVVITPQGYLRNWDSAGHVSAAPWESAPQILPHAVTVLSDEDLGHDAALEAAYAAQARALVVTRGYLGATLYQDGTRRDFDAPAIVRLRHPTGAGDVFAAAFIASLSRCGTDHSTDDWDQAMRAAVAVASVFVERCPDPGAPSLSSMTAILTDERVRATVRGG